MISFNAMLMSVLKPLMLLNGLVVLRNVATIMLTVLLLLILIFRLVCESLLSCEQLKPHNEDFWCLSFNLLLRIIGNVDYKVW